MKRDAKCSGDCHVMMLVINQVTFRCLIGWKWLWADLTIWHGMQTIWSASRV